MIKPIETSYKNYRFRSRLEARWAVFFDTLGLKWEYEPEGYDLGDGVWYLPDFRVTSPQGMVTWYEVKPENVVSDKKFERFRDAATREGAPFQSAVLLSGDPAGFIGLERDDKAVPRVCPRCGIVCVPAYGTLNFHTEMGFGCWPCDQDTPSGGDNPEERGVVAPTYPHKGYICLSEKYMSLYFARVRYATKKARSARFGKGGRG